MGKLARKAATTCVLEVVEGPTDVQFQNRVDFHDGNHALCSKQGLNWLTARHCSELSRKWWPERLHSSHQDVGIEFLDYLQE